MHQHDTSKKWVLYEHVPIEGDRMYEYMKGFLRKQFPESFILPFQDRSKWVSVQNVLDGKSDTFVYSNNRVALNKCIRLGKGRDSNYRLEFTLSSADDPEKVVYPGYFELSPSLSWMITKGKIRTEEWEIEYGDRIDGVPIIKKVIYKNLVVDQETKKGAIRPIYEITVKKAEKYTVNPVEFEPEYYGIQLPEKDPNVFDPERAKTIPPVVYVAVFGMVCFIAGVLLLHRAQQRARRAGKESGEVSPPAPA